VAGGTGGTGGVERSGCWIGAADGWGGIAAVGCGGIAALAAGWGGIADAGFGGITALAAATGTPAVAALTGAADDSCRFRPQLLQKTAPASSG